MTDGYDVHKGDMVVISSHNNPSKQIEGEVHKIQSGGDPSKISVVLRNGDSGIVIRIINSDSSIEKRIMFEDHHTENKADFMDDVMRYDAIPKTVQSFLNADGGYLYIGVGDTGDLSERLLGLGDDFEAIRQKPEDGTDKLCDLMEMRIMDSLEKHLASDAILGELVSIRFPKIRDVIIAEISIGKSKHPWFYKNLTKQNKEKMFTVSFSGESDRTRVLDDFYIRRGNSKKPLTKIQDFYDYAKKHFVNL